MYVVLTSVIEALRISILCDYGETDVFTESTV
jgi:hypothetical protein